jgi:hypothetical protein
MDALWGLARLGLDAEGREELVALGIDPLPDGLLNKRTVIATLNRIYQSAGYDAAVAAADAMRRRGFAVARQSGWSMGPFLGHTLAFPTKPGDDEWLDAWPRYAEEVTDLLSRKPSFDDNDLDPARLSALSGARGLVRLLAYYTAGWGTVQDANGVTVPIREGLVDGLSPRQSALLALGARRMWYTMVQREMAAGSPRAALAVPGSWPAPTPSQSVTGHHVVARAMRATCPGAVLARAAAAGEDDPLVDLDSRLFVGLAPE